MIFYYHQSFTYHLITRSINIFFEMFHPYVSHYSFSTIPIPDYRTFSMGPITYDLCRKSLLDLVTLPKIYSRAKRESPEKWTSPFAAIAKKNPIIFQKFGIIEKSINWYLDEDIVICTTSATVEERMTKRRKLHTTPDTDIILHSEYTYVKDPVLSFIPFSASTATSTVTSTVKSIPSQVLGQGTYGVVTKLANDQVQKRVRKTYTDERGKRDDFFEDSTIREICALTQFSPYINKCRKVVISEETVDINMDHLGITLMEWCNKYRINQRIEMLPSFLLQLVETLYFFEKINIFHGDIKPWNIMIDSAGKITLIDWGTLCLFPSKREINLCTAEFAAPEHFKVDSPRNRIGSKSDIFSVGLCIKYIIYKTCYWNKAMYEKYKDKKYYPMVNNKDTKILGDIDYAVVILWERMLAINDEDRISADELYRNLNPPLKLNVSSYPIISYDFTISRNNWKGDNITYQMREITVNWMYKVCERDETLHSLTLSVWILDKYVSIVSITKIKLQLIAIGSMAISQCLLASYQRSIPDWYNICDTAYTTQEIEDVVWEIIRALKGRIYMKMFDHQDIVIDYNLIALILVNKDSANWTPGYLEGMYAAISSDSNSRTSIHNLLSGIEHENDENLSIKKVVKTNYLNAEKVQPT